MVDSAGGRPLVGGVSVSAAIGALRDELMHAVWAGQGVYALNGQPYTLRFKPAPVEVSLQVAVTSAGKGSVGVKWWLIEAGGELSRQLVSTQTVKLVLEPVMFDARGQQVEFLIDAADTEQDSATSGAGEALSDAAD